MLDVQAGMQKEQEKLIKIQQPFFESEGGLSKLLAKFERDWGEKKITSHMKLNDSQVELNGVVQGLSKLQQELTKIQKKYKEDMLEQTLEQLKLKNGIDALKLLTDITPKIVMNIEQLDHYNKIKLKITIRNSGNFEFRMVSSKCFAEDVEPYGCFPSLNIPPHSERSHILETNSRKRVGSEFTVRVTAALNYEVQNMVLSLLESTCREARKKCIAFMRREVGTRQMII
jgi:hypothetical protein